MEDHEIFRRGVLTRGQVESILSEFPTCSSEQQEEILHCLMWICINYKLENIRRQRYGELEDHRLRIDSIHSTAKKLRSLITEEPLKSDLLIHRGEEACLDFDTRSEILAERYRTLDALLNTIVENTIELISEPFVLPFLRDDVFMYDGGKCSL
jgi:hypothetical protein